MARVSRRSRRARGSVSRRPRRARGSVARTRRVRRSASRGRRAQGPGSVITKTGKLIRRTRNAIGRAYKRMERSADPPDVEVSNTPEGGGSRRKDQLEDVTIHEKMYRIATARYNPFAIGGSENCDSDISCNIGGSENVK